MFPSHRFPFCESSQRCFSGTALAPRGLSRNRALVNLDIILGSFSRSAGAFPSISRFMLTNAESFKSLFHESTIQVQQLGPQPNVTLSYCAACFSLHCTVLIKARGARSGLSYRALSLPWDLMKFMLRYLDRKATSCSLVLRRDDSCESSDQTPSDREVWVTETNTPGPMLRTLLWLMCLDLSINSFSLFMSRRRAVWQQQGL